MNQNKEIEKLNKYIIRADAETNEWVFSGEVWEAIEQLLIKARIDEIEMFDSLDMDKRIKELKRKLK